MREQIIERVTREYWESYEYEATWETLVKEDPQWADMLRGMTTKILELAGFFELLEAAEDVVKERNAAWGRHYSIPQDVSIRIDALYNAITKAKGDL